MLVVVSIFFKYIEPWKYHLKVEQFENQIIELSSNNCGYGHEIYTKNQSWPKTNSVKISTRYLNPIRSYWWFSRNLESFHGKRYNFPVSQNFALKIWMKIHWSSMKIPGKFLENLGFAGKPIKIQSFTLKFQKIFLDYLLYIKYRRAPNSRYFLI